MADRRLEDFAALEAQLHALEQAKNELKDLYQARKDKIVFPKVQEPKSKRDEIERQYDKDIADLQDRIKSLEKTKPEHPAEGAISYITIIAAIAATIATFIITADYFSQLDIDRLIKILFRLGLPALVGIAIFFAGFILVARLTSKAEEKQKEEIEIYKNRIQEKKEERTQEKAKVAESDKTAKKEYNKRCQEVTAECNAKYNPLIEAKEKEIEALKEKYKSVSVLPFTIEQRKELKKIMWALRESYAESIPEARRFLLDKENQEKLIKDQQTANMMHFYAQQDLQNTVNRNMEKMREDAQFQADLDARRKEKHRKEVEETLKDIRDKM